MLLVARAVAHNPAMLPAPRPPSRAPAPSLAAPAAPPARRASASAAARALLATVGAAALLLLGPAAAVAAPVSVATPAALAAPAGDGAVADPKAAFASILEADLLADLQFLTAPQLEGRDSPSVGQTRAAEHIAARLKAAGFTGAGEGGSFLLPFTRQLPAPVPEQCALSLHPASGDAGSEPRVFAYGTDFVPVWQTGGTARGEAVFLGFGIDSDADKYDDIKGEFYGKVAVIVEAEPRHKKLFEGPEVSPAADLYEKLLNLREAKCAGVLIVRRPELSDDGKPAAPPAGGRGATTGQDAPPAEPEPAPQLAFRHTWADWAGHPQHKESAVDMPVLEITAAVGSAIIGEDVLALASKVDASGKAPKPLASGREVSLSGKCEVRELTLHNVVGVLRGTDPALAAEHLVIGAHYDHLGVDPRGRVAEGADDNASGTAALMEIAAALGMTPPRRSVLACAFAAEEDGLLGSKALCDKPPVPKDSMVAMINMDMIGRGEADTVYVIGLVENPTLEKLLDRAKKLQPSKVKKIVGRQGQDLFERSDHYSFHRIGVPVLFFFENLPIDKNADYHTWRDTLDKLDLDKVARTTRLVFNTAWLLANDDDRPPKPGK
jgi:hypothetical protein